MAGLKPPSNFLLPKLSHSGSSGSGRTESSLRTPVKQRVAVIHCP